jgi:hypothetical protein
MMIVPRRLESVQSSYPEGILGRLIRAFPARTLAEADAEVTPTFVSQTTPVAASLQQNPVRRSWVERFDNWLWRLEQREREAYLAGAGDVTELEARMRALEYRRSRSGYPI